MSEEQREGEGDLGRRGEKRAAIAAPKGGEGQGPRD